MTEKDHRHPDPQSLYPRQLAALVNRKLEELAGNYKGVPPELEAPIRYCLLSGGKRFRPVLGLATAVSLGKKPEYVLPVTCAIEFIHTYSLIHDDLPAIDDDDLRRGRPSCHRKFGEDIAILAGDALFAEAFNLIIKEQPGTPERILKALGEVSGASGAWGMVAGQVRSHSLAQITIAPGKASSPHFHEHSEESYFILSGEASLEIDHQKISLLPGEAILIEPYEVHKISNQSNQDLVFIAVCVPAWSPDDSFDADKSD